MCGVSLAQDIIVLFFCSTRALTVYAYHKRHCSQYKKKSINIGIVVMGDNLKRMGDAGEGIPLQSHHPRYFETPDGRPSFERGRGHRPSSTHYRQPSGSHPIALRPHSNHPPGSFRPQSHPSPGPHSVPIRSTLVGSQTRPHPSTGLQARPHPSTGLQTRPHPSTGLQARPHPSTGLQTRPYQPTQSPSNPHGARYNQPLLQSPQYSSTPNNLIGRPIHLEKDAGAQTTLLATPTTSHMARDSDKSVKIGDKLYKSYNKQGKVRVVVPGSLSMAPPLKSKFNEKPYDRIRGRSLSDPGTPPLVSDPPRRSSGQSGLIAASSDQSSSPNLTSKKTVTFALPSPTDHTHNMDTPTKLTIKSMSNLRDSEKTFSSTKPMASLSTGNKENPTYSGHDKERGVVSPAVGVVKSNTGLQTSKSAGNNTSDYNQSSNSKKNVPHSSIERSLSDTRQGNKAVVNKNTPISPSLHHNKPLQTASTPTTQPSTSGGSIDALLSSSLNSLVSNLISSKKASNSTVATSVQSTSAKIDKITKRKQDGEIESVGKKRKMSSNSTSEDEMRSSSATAVPSARKKPRKSVAVKKTPYKEAVFLARENQRKREAVKKTPYKETTGAESTGKVDQHELIASKKSTNTSELLPAIKTELGASPIRSKNLEAKDPSGIDAMMARAHAFLMSKSPKKNSSDTSDRSIQDPLSTQPIPLPKALSPHATCRFKHVDGTLCSNEATNGERLCSEHIKYPEKLKAMLGLSPIKTPRNILKSCNDTPTPSTHPHVVTTPCPNTPEPNNDIHSTDPSLTTPSSSISVVSIISNDSLNETQEPNEEQKTSKVIDSSNSNKEKDSNPLVKNPVRVPDPSASTSVPPPFPLAPPTDEDMMVDMVPFPLDTAHNQSHDLKTELAGLNKREELLQTALVESGAGLSKLNDEIRTVEDKLQQLASTKDQLMKKCDMLTREYQEVLSLKQSLLISKYVPKYVPNPVKESKSPPPPPPNVTAEPHSHNQSHSHTPQSHSDSGNTTQQHKNPLKRSSDSNPNSETLTPKRINTTKPSEVGDKTVTVATHSDSGNTTQQHKNSLKRLSDSNPNSETLTPKRINTTKPSEVGDKTVTVATPMEAESQSSKQKEAVVLVSPISEVFFNPLTDVTASVVSGSPQKIPTFKSYSHSVLCLKVHDDKLFACSSNNEIRSYCLKTGKVLKEYTPHQKSVTCLALHHTDKASFILSGSSDKLVHLNNIETGKVATKFKCTTRVMYIVVDNSLLYIAQHSGVVAIINLKTRQLMSKHKCHDQDRAISSLAVHKSSLFTASFDNTVICWDITDAVVVKGGKFKKIKVLKEFSNTVLCMKVHNGMLFCGSADKSLQVFKIETWEKLHCLKCHNGAVTALEVIGKVLVTSCFDKLVRCFDIERLQLLQVYGGHDDMIFSLTSSNGVIYTGCRNGVIRGILLDLTKFYQCKWKNCELRFGVLEHLKDHVKVHPPPGKGAHSCQWEYCHFYGLNLIQHIQDVHLCQFDV